MSKKRQILFTIPEGSKVTECRNCKAPIVWVTVGATDKKPGKLMPVSIRGATKNVLGEFEGESHFAACPDADRWRKEKR